MEHPQNIPTEDRAAASRPAPNPMSSGAADAVDTASSRAKSLELGAALNVPRSGTVDTTQSPGTVAVELSGAHLPDARLHVPGTLNAPAFSDASLRVQSCRTSWEH